MRPGEAETFVIPQTNMRLPPETESIVRSIHAASGHVFERQVGVRIISQLDCLMCIAWFRTCCAVMMNSVSHIKVDFLTMWWVRPVKAVGVRRTTVVFDTPSRKALR